MPRQVAPFQAAAATGIMKGGTPSTAGLQRGGGQKFMPDGEEGDLVYIVAVPCVPRERLSMHNGEARPELGYYAAKPGSSAPQVFQSDGTCRPSRTKNHHESSQERRGSRLNTQYY